MTFANPDPVEKLRRMADTLGEGSGFFLQRCDDGRYGAGVGGACGTIHDVRDAATLDEAIDGVAALILTETHTRLNEINHREAPQLRQRVDSLERLGYK